MGLGIQLERLHALIKILMFAAIIVSSHEENIDILSQPRSANLKCC